MNTQNQSNADSPVAEPTTVSIQKAQTIQPERTPVSDPRRRTRAQAPKRPNRRPKRYTRKRRFTARQLKSQIQAKLGCLSNGRLKQVLIACGIAAGLAVAIIAFTKFVPVGVAILAILGLGVVVRFMQELRRLPFCANPQ